ncbi:MAG TPA: hydrogenase maturation protease [Thermoplasmata archaeon]|nr:hydrogenase maturation protease [Thermoplasmata archaeon]
MTDRPLVIGVGNRHRRDDALGLEAAGRLQPRLAERARVVPYEGESTGLLELWNRVPLVVLVDAVPAQGHPGRIHRVEGDLVERLTRPTTTSTHGLSVGEAVRLGASLDQLPGRLVVFAVEGEDFSPGVGLSPSVARAVDPVADAVLAEVGGDRAPASREVPTDA